jgi:hypothetical protein
MMSFLITNPAFQLRTASMMVTVLDNRVRVMNSSSGSLKWKSDWWEELGFNHAFMSRLCM